VNRASRCAVKINNRKFSNFFGRVVFCTPIPDIQANERALSGIHAALEGQQFESIEEANAFLHAQLASGGFPPVNKKGATPLEKAQDIVYDAWDAQV
jgi:hypothetical protein